MSKSTKVIAAVVALLTLVLQVPGAQEIVGGFLTNHPNVSAIVAGVASILALLRKPE